MLQVQTIKTTSMPVVSFVNPKSGATTFTFQTKKDFGAAKGIKGAELRRQHSQYRKDFGVKLNQQIAAGLASGQIVAQKARMGKAGDTMAVNFVAPQKLEVKQSAKQKSAVVAAVSAAVNEVNEKAIAALVAKGCTREEAMAFLK
jgi:hypothetical protein